MLASDAYPVKLRVVSEAHSVWFCWLTGRAYRWLRNIAERPCCPGRRLRPSAACTLAFCAALGASRAAQARPNTHAPSISTWDERASSVVLSLGRAVSGDGAFTFASYNANFSSTSGVLSAQFGVHYLTYQDTNDGPTARGVSAGGVALISLPLADRFANGVPGSSFAFYIGGVPTALFSGQLNFISVPLVLGVGLPFSPSPSVTFRPWVELSPGLNFDTRIQAVSTAAAVQAAMDGSLTREEVEALVEEGLDIQSETTVGKRAGLSFGVHLGERVDVDLNLLIGAGHSSAVSLAGGLVFRWDAMVPGVLTEGERLRGEDCAAVEARFRSCPGARPEQRSGLTPRQPERPSPASNAPASTRSEAARARPADARARPTPAPVRPASRWRRPAPSAAPAAAPAPAKKPAVQELPPLQAAPARIP